jgi:hypothetical protein
MKKYAWIVALLAALAFAFAFVACDDGDSSKKKKDENKDLPEVTVAGADIVIRAVGGKESTFTIDKNTFEVADQECGSIGFAYDFPAEVIGKGYGSVIVEMELLAVTTPDFISFNGKSDDKLGNDVLIVGHTQQYHNELKIGTIVDKAAGEACSANCLKYTAGTSIVGAKNSAEYPMSKLTNGLIAFQFNSYAGDITTPGWVNGGATKVTFKVAVTKITFPGGAAAEEEKKEEAAAGVIFDLAEWIVGKDAIGAPLQQAGSPTITVAATGITVSGRTSDYFSFDLQTTSLNLDYTKFNYNLTVTGSLDTLDSDASKNYLKAGQKNSPYNEVGRVQATTANTAVTFTQPVPEKDAEDADFGDIRIQTTGLSDYTITGLKLEAVAK